MGTDNGVTLHLGDCLDVLAAMEPDSVDTCITDPPYGLEFMGKEWDRLWNDKPYGEDNQRPTDENGVSTGLSRWTITRPQYEGGLAAQEWHQRWASAVLRVLKPGAMLLAFGGTRTHHRLMCAIEDAGFEIRDVLMWVYGSGFPKSHDISKAIDKAAGAEREVVGMNPNHRGESQMRNPYTKSLGQNGNITAPATDAAALWDGWGTALKPAYEPIILAMKPRDGTFANNALVHSVAGLWIDGGRIPLNGNDICRPKRAQDGGNKVYRQSGRYEPTLELKPSGRWPANLLLDEEAGRLLDEQSGERASGGRKAGQPRNGRTDMIQGLRDSPGINDFQPDTGGASRYFMRFAYVPKAPKDERWFYCAICDDAYPPAEEGNHHHDIPSRERKHIIKHPTQKPVALMEYLSKLTKTPTGGSVLDMFMGSGSTGEGCILTGRRFIGIEIERSSYMIAQRRIEHAQNQVRQLELIP